MRCKNLIVRCNNIIFDIYLLLVMVHLHNSGDKKSGAGAFIGALIFGTIVFFVSGGTAAAATVAVGIFSSGTAYGAPSSRR